MSLPCKAMAGLITTSDDASATPATTPADELFTFESNDSGSLAWAGCLPRDVRVVLRE